MQASSPNTLIHQEKGMQKYGPSIMIIQEKLSKQAYPFQAKFEGA
jgi:hypothetical protein